MCTPRGGVTERNFSAMIRDTQISLLMGAVALGLLLGALGFQYLGHLAACEMCHWQRWPHIAAAIIGLGVVPFWKGDKPPLIVTTIVLTAVIGMTLQHQWPRWPFALALIALLVLVTFWKKDRPVAVVLMLVALSGLIGAYQYGMQLGFLPGPEACTGARYVIGSNAPPPEVSCNAITWSLFGLSLAAFNAIISLGAAAVGTIALLRKA